MKNDCRHLLFASLILPVCMAFTPIAYADSYLLTVGGNEINVNYFSFASSQTPLGEVDFNVDIGKASPFLFQSLVEGTHFKTAVLDVFYAGAADPFETISFSDSVATNISINDNPGGTPTEDVDFAYEQIKIEYSPGGRSGTSPIPEPGSFMLLGSGLVGLVVIVRSRMVRRG